MCGQPAAALGCAGRVLGLCWLRASLLAAGQRAARDAAMLSGSSQGEKPLQHRSCWRGARLHRAWHKRFGAPQYKAFICSPSFPPPRDGMEGGTDPERCACPCPVPKRNATGAQGQPLPCLNPLPGGSWGARQRARTASRGCRPRTTAVGAAAHGTLSPRGCALRAVG